MIRTGRSETHVLFSEPAWRSGRLNMQPPKVLHVAGRLTSLTKHTPAFPIDDNDKNRAKRDTTTTADLDEERRQSWVLCHTRTTGVNQALQAKTMKWRFVTAGTLLGFAPHLPPQNCALRHFDRQPGSISDVTPRAPPGTAARRRGPIHQNDL